MKKLLGILVLGLLICNNADARSAKALYWKECKNVNADDSFYLKKSAATFNFYYHKSGALGRVAFDYLRVYTDEAYDLAIKNTKFPMIFKGSNHSERFKDRSSVWKYNTRNVVGDLIAIKKDWSNGREDVLIDLSNRTIVFDLFPKSNEYAPYSIKLKCKKGKSISTQESTQKNIQDKTNILLLLITIIPSLLIVWLFVTYDYFKEPRKEVIKVFLFGFLITIPAYFLNTYIGLLFLKLGITPLLVDSFLTAAWIEEGLKFSILYYIVYKMKEFNEPIDGMVYGVCASLGFATLENFYYVYVMSFQDTGPFAIALLRSFSAVPAHGVFGAVMGYFFMKYSFVKRDNNLILCFVIPFLLHGFYNLLVNLDFRVAIILVIAAWIVAVRLFLQLRKKQKRKTKEHEPKVSK